MKFGTEFINKYGVTFKYIGASAYRRKIKDSDGNIWNIKVNDLNSILANGYWKLLPESSSKPQ